MLILFQIRGLEQRKIEEREFRYFTCAENVVTDCEFYFLYLFPCNSLLPNSTESLATEANLKWNSISSLPDQVLGSKLVICLFQAHARPRNIVYNCFSL